ncbi:hypothetical protein V1L54_25685 [Streptomyces sp. TRM 70361]|uniref:3-dehydroquinate synthase family protein n=1 Tax=Streptomyces sp. TRM 70361 TaxID=3116553 RepID=UPI002E7B0C94|nr:hypothetical protein [Streptomyces sp. TRM 70361]MEE1942759.1 hypothetical protein [Streptomyces sp. TRM 70361]
MLERHIPLDGHETPYLYGVDCGTALAEALAARTGSADSVLLVADRKVAAHTAPLARQLSHHVKVETFGIDASETNKTMSLVQGVAESAISRGVNRSSLVIGMGGGMVGNVAGLTAALLFRGTGLIHLPTTPVAAFDSVVSVKQAVNLRGGKNLCGTYYAPSLIACDLRWLSTVPHEELFTGLSEMAKNVLAVLPGEEETLRGALSALPGERIGPLLQLFDIGVTAKEPFLRQDPRERREALIFEYGHTVGHALEFISGGSMKHGEAVAWGMLVAAEVSHSLGILGGEDLRSHYRIVDWLRLPDPRTRLGRFDRAELRAKLATDNKRGYIPCGRDEVAMVLLESLGGPLAGESGYPLVPVPQETVMAALETVTEHSWTECGGTIGEREDARWKTSNLL